MTLHDHDVNRRAAESRGLLPIVLGAAAVIIVGALYFSGERGNLNRVTNDPGVTQAPGK